MNIRDIVLDNPKTGAVVATATSASGFSTLLDLIPDDIGKLATLVGIALSVVLIRAHWIRGSSERETSKLQQEKLQIELDKLRNETNVTGGSGGPTLKTETPQKED